MSSKEKSQTKEKKDKLIKVKTEPKESRQSSKEQPEKKLNSQVNLERTRMRMEVWHNTFGIDTGSAKCPYCKINSINSFNFECGHITAKAKGGKLIVENLKPICSTCNKSMGTNVMDLSKYHVENNVHSLNQTLPQFSDRSKKWENSTPSSSNFPQNNPNFSNSQLLHHVPINASAINLLDLSHLRYI